MHAGESLGGKRWALAASMRRTLEFGARTGIAKTANVDADSAKSPICVDLLQPSDALRGALFSAIDTFRAVNDIALSRSGRASEGAVAWRYFDEDLQQITEQRHIYRDAKEPGWSLELKRVRATLVPPWK